jgi:type II secretory pathway predicted ATPase ExeA
VEGLKTPSVVSFQAPADALTYEPYFGLDEKPFSLNADARFVYDSPAYTKTRDGLLAGIRRREGLLVLTGEIGTGKTTVCRAVLRELGRKTYSSIVPDPFASREDLLKMLLVDFGVLSIQELTDGRLRQASRTELGYLLAEFLNSLALDAYVVVILDEAQNLSLPLIEETRILSDTFGSRGRLQMVFAGQPELHAKLKLPEMRQVDQRVCGYHRLTAMSRDAVAGYIQHRLAAAGGSPERVLFPPAIVDALHRRSGGVPRLINRVCDRALHLAHERRAEAVDQEILETALLELGSATLSPTWDAIVFAEPSAPPATSPVAAPAPAAAAAPVVAAKPVKKPAPMVDETADFQEQIDSWVEQDLGPESRRLTSRPLMAADVAPRPRAAGGRAPRREMPIREVKTDWPRDLRSETYMQRLWRVWSKRAAVAIAAFAAVNLALVGVSMLPGFKDATVVPPLTDLTATAHGISPLATSVGDSRPSGDAPLATVAAEPAAAAEISGDFLIAVGLFAGRERADQLVESLTQAGLPAMQRPFQMNRGEVQQVVLGPFFTRAEADADLRRLKELGGFADASVISASQ